MLKKLSNVFNITNYYIVLATPLILYSLLSQIYLAISINGKIWQLLCAFIVSSLMFITFLAGWFNMIKIAVSTPLKERPNTLLNDFAKGVGEYFLPVTGAVFNVSIISVILLILAVSFGNKFIGSLNISPDTVSTAFQTPETLKAFLLTLTPDQIQKIKSWYLILTLTTTSTFFLIMFYLPAMFIETKNSFKSLIISWKRLFSKKFINNIGILILITITYFFISILVTLSTENLLFNFITTLINFYFIIIIFVGIFYYYNETFCQEHLGQNIDESV